LETLYRAHEKGVPSGLLFLADFGESVPSVVTYTSKAQKHAGKILEKDKGTLGDTSGGQHSSMSSRSGSMRSFHSTSSNCQPIEGGPSTGERSRGMYICMYVYITLTL
jgi:hypothetical protein